MCHPFSISLTGCKRQWVHERLLSFRRSGYATVHSSKLTPCHARTLSLLNRFDLPKILLGAISRRIF